MKIEICVAIPENAFEIQEVMKSSSHSMYVNSECNISKEDFNEKYKEILSEQKVKNCAEHIANLSINERFIIAKVEGEIVGLCYIERVATQTVLHALYVSSEYQGNGVATMLWSDVVPFIDPNKETTLKVLVCNDKAISFYKKAGFVDSGKRFSDEEGKFPVSGKVLEEMEMVRDISGY